MANGNSAPKSLADLVLDANNYSALVAASEPKDKPKRTSRSSGPKQAHNPSPRSPPSQTDSPSNPSISISDLVLNNVTYDAILASSAKKLSVEQPTGVDVPSPVNMSFPPPNTPIDRNTAQRSLEQVVEDAIRSSSREA